MTGPSRQGGSSLVVLLLLVVLVAVAGTWLLMSRDAAAREAEARREVERLAAELRARPSHPLPEGAAEQVAEQLEPRPDEGAGAQDAAPAEEAPHTYEAGDPAGLLLFGVVYGPDGEPLDVREHWVSWQVGGERKYVRIEDGAYAFAGLQPGTGTLSAALHAFARYNTGALGFTTSEQRQLS